jgi:hypothetical protein
MKIYLSGPMTGKPDFNYPAFNKAALELEELGYDVENPASNSKQDSWEDYMREALKQMLECDAVALLPGHQFSKGATEEIRIAKMLGIPIKTIQNYLNMSQEICETIISNFKAYNQKAG